MKKLFFLYFCFYSNEGFLKNSPQNSNSTKQTTIAVVGGKQITFDNNVFLKKISNLYNIQINPKFELYGKEIDILSLSLTKLVVELGGGPILLSLIISSKEKARLEDVKIVATAVLGFVFIQLMKDTTIKEIIENSKNIEQITKGADKVALQQASEKLMKVIVNEFNEIFKSGDYIIAPNGEKVPVENIINTNNINEVGLLLKLFRFVSVALTNDFINTQNNMVDNKKLLEILSRIIQQLLQNNMKKQTNQENNNQLNNNNKKKNFPKKDSENSKL